MKKLQVEKKDKLIMLNIGIFLICFLCVGLSSLEQYLKIIVCCSLMILLVSAILVEKNITKEEIKEHMKEILCACCVLFMILLFVYYKYLRFDWNSGSTQNILLFTAVFLIGVSILLSIILYFCHPQKIHLSTGIVVFSVGIVYMCAMPVSMVPDESVHLFTAYHTSNMMMGIDENGCEKKGCVMMREEDSLYNHQVYNYTDENIVSFLSQIGQKSTNENLVASGWDTMYGNEYLFIPCSLGISVARLLHLNTASLFFLGRLFNFLFYVALSMLAVYLIPFGKLLLSSILTMPMSFQQGMSFSYDVCVNSIAFLSAAIAFKFAYENTKKVNWKKAIPLLFFTFILAKAKGHAYITIALLPYIILFMNHLKYSNKKQTKIILKTVFVILMTIMIGLGIMMIVNNNHLVSYTPSYLSYADAEKYSISFLLNHPRYIPRIIFETLFVYGPYYLLTFVGHLLGWLELEISSIYIKIELMILAVFTVFSDTKKITSNKRTISIIASLISIVFIFAGLLLAWTPINTVLVQGVQGRYFIPVALPLLLGLGGIKAKKLNLSWFYLVQNCLVILMTFDMIHWFFR